MTARIDAPTRMDRPAAGDPVRYRFWLYAGRNLEHLPVFTATSNLGIDRSGNFDAVHKPPETVGIYFADYCLKPEHPPEPLEVVVLHGDASTACNVRVEPTAGNGYTPIDRARDTAVAQYVATLHNNRIPGPISPQSGDAFELVRSVVAKQLEEVQEATNQAVGASSAVLKILGGITSLAGWLRAIMRRDAGDKHTHDEINGGLGNFTEQAHSLEALAARQTHSGENQASVVTGFSDEALGALRDALVDIQQPPQVGEPVRVVRGMDYTTDVRRAIVWRDRKGNWPDLAGATITVICWKAKTNRTWTGSVLGGSPQRVKLELSRHQTQTLEPGEWQYGVMATLAGGRTVDLITPGSKGAVWAVSAFPKKGQA